MFIQNRAKSIAQRLNAKNIAPLRAKITEFADKFAESGLDSANLRIKIDDVISVEIVDSALSAESSGNILSLRDSAKQNRGNPPIEKTAESQGGLQETSHSLVLPRRFCESARNDDSFLDSTNLLAMAENKGIAESTPSLELEALLKDLKPWRKGPFNICGTLVQSEWDSAIKFNIIAPHLSVEGKVVADIGCNNGYYAFRLLPLRPSKIVGFEPSAHCKMQFDLINAFVRSEIRFEMLGVEDLAEYDCKFDCILCLGVIYHRTNPIDCLKILRGALNPRGELIIDTLIIEGESEIVLSPLSYAKMKNVYFIPSISAFKNWLKRAGFREIELLGVRKTTSAEQRKTAWSGGESLEDFLDKDDKNKTIEGYSAPTRAYFKARI